MMANRPYDHYLRDTTVWRAQFHGLKMFAFGREQILDYKAEIEVVQVQLQPVRWMARVSHGDYEPFFRNSSAEEVMRSVAECFTTQLTTWEGYLRGGLIAETPLRPQLVSPRRKRAI